MPLTSPRLGHGVPADADWLHFGRYVNPGPSVQQLAQRWTWAGERNAQLDQAIAKDL
jgi:hypothetical protein